MIRIAAIQTTPGIDIQSRRRQIHTILSKMDKAHVDFACFPEGFLTGYYVDENIARNNSIEVQGTLFQEWLAELSCYNCTIIIGFNEQQGSDIFNSAAAIEKGKLLGIQKKHYLYHDYFTPGTEFTSFQSRGVSFGIIVCLDSNYFEPSRLLALQGATILFCPMCNKVPLKHSYAKRPPYYSHFVARSHENRCWLIAADWIWADDGELICPGHSCIYDPDGQEMSRSLENQEDLLIVDIPKDFLFHDKGRRVHGNSVLAKKFPQFFRK